jgi:UPF0271 protein
MRRVLDLNSDLGESFGRWVLGDDEAMLGLVTSANVACGFHAGDATTLRRTCALAAEHDVVIGAQVGYRDLAGFGRRFIDMDPGELADDVLYQIGALEGLSRVAGTRVRYVKPHGAAVHTRRSTTRRRPGGGRGRAGYDATLPVLGLPDRGCSRRPRRRGCARCRSSSSTAATRRRVRSCRGSQDGALLHDPDDVTVRVVRMVEDAWSRRWTAPTCASAPEFGRACTGTRRARVAMAAAVRDGLAAAGVELHAFV